MIQCHNSRQSLPGTHRTFDGRCKNIPRRVGNSRILDVETSDQDSGNEAKRRIKEIQPYWVADVNRILTEAEIKSLVIRESYLQRFWSMAESCRIHTILLLPRRRSTYHGMFPNFRLRTWSKARVFRKCSSENDGFTCRRQAHSNPSLHIKQVQQ